MNINIPLILYTSKEELLAAKSGSSMILASAIKTEGKPFSFTAILDSCDVIDEQNVRVNLAILKDKAESAAKEYGEAIGKALAEVIEQSVG